MMRATLFGTLVVDEISADAIAFFLEHWGTLHHPDSSERQIETREAIELAAAEAIAARYQLRVEWHPSARNLLCALYEQDLYVDSQTWELGLTDAAQRIYGALLVLNFLRRRNKVPA